MLTSTSTSDREQQGVVLCLLAAAGFGAMAIFAKLAYRAGFDATSLLLGRFVVAAIVLWAVVAIRRPARPALRTVLIAVALGAIGYAVQAATFFLALERIDASLASLLLYVYPTLVLVGAILLGRERATRRRVGALALASAGTVLVLAGGASGALDPAGVALALGAAVSYTGYILVADRTVGAADPVLLVAMIITAAAVVVGLFDAATGGPQLAHIAPAGWASVAGVAVVSTVLPVIAFLLGMQRIGPATASIVSTVEPVITVALAMAVFGEQLAPVQVLGGLAVLSAVVLVNLRRRVRSVHGAPARSAAPAPAGPLAHQPARG
jgi:drug/metabolite transporter (DMT)-like permease